MGFPETFGGLPHQVSGLVRNDIVFDNLKRILEKGSVFSCGFDGRKIQKDIIFIQTAILSPSNHVRLGALRKAYQTLSDDERKLLCLYYYHELSMEEIGRRLGVTKMAISKRLRKILDHLRSLMIHEAPQIFRKFGLQSFCECPNK